MKYHYRTEPVPQDRRKDLNDKVLYLIDNGIPHACGITPEDIYNAYTGTGGLHSLNRDDYDSYHSYSQAKKEIEKGQFFTPPALCEFITACLKPSECDLVADLTCGMGSFFNFMPSEANLYGCELDANTVKVARFLYPEAAIECKDIRICSPENRFDYVVGNPPFHLRWWTKNGKEVPSQMYYCMKAATLLKPLGILALIVPQSFLGDSFIDGGQIKEMEKLYSFLGQLLLPENAFSSLGVSSFPTKLQFWQRRTVADGWKPRPYRTETGSCLPKDFDIHKEAADIHQKMLSFAKSALENNQAKVLLELAKSHSSSEGFRYQTQKLLYQIKAHPATRPHYARCCEYLHRFYTQHKPDDMPYEEWCRVQITEKKVLSYLRSALKKQVPAPERDETALVKRDGEFAFKGYSATARKRLKAENRMPVPIHQAVLDNKPEDYPGYERLLRKKRREYDCQRIPFADMEEDPQIADWLSEFSLWDASLMEEIKLNGIQRHDINLTLQKRYALLQWEQGSGKTLAGIATGLYRMQNQHVHSTWVVSSAISIRNNWDVVLNNYGLPYLFVKKLKDLKRIEPGYFVLFTLNMVSSHKKQIKKHIRRLNRNIQLVLDESDEISNPESARCQAVLSCFRRCRMKLLTTGTSTRNNIAEFAPQLELLYNNSVNMLSLNPYIYRHKRGDGEESLPEQEQNPFFGQPIPAYKKGYSLFSASHLPEKITVFGLEKRTQDIYNADILNDILGKTVITRTFEEVSRKDIKQLHQVLLRFSPEEKEVYRKAVREFQQMREHYFASTGNARKDSMMRLVQQIVLLLRISAAPDTVKEYTGDTPVKVMTAVEMAAQWENEIIAVGVRHKAVLDSYAKAFREYLPDRPLFTVTGDTASFAQRRALKQTLKDSGNGILLCTQQSLPSSVNFEYVNKVIIPELHYNNSGMSQFYFRFIRYTSTEAKDIYFLTYAGSIESNLMQMVLAKEKLNLFMKGQDVNLDEIYEKFNVDYDLLSLLMRQEKDEDGTIRLQWGEQKIA
ncbi:MAG: N-6 DNA methylase [Lachnospiraceae bacterium]|nr:N-6 DNA methylase [uncultured Acetatifactor sp.]MCI8287393.1 N-6 DNA methylase [Lachnospiraceae bacterium]